MVSIKQAVESAAAFAQTVLEPNRLVDLRLEEVESGMVGPQAVWQITLSMLEARGPLASVAIASVLGSSGPREYKTFTVNRETGEVLAMKIRELAGA